jgi:hypothetical protein
MGYRGGVPRPLTSLAALLAAGALIAGCGGGGGDDSSTSAATTGPLTKDAYIARGDQICSQGTLTIGQAGREQFGSSQPTQDQAVQFGQDVVVPSLEDTLTKLRALEPPAGDQSATSAIYDALGQAVDKLKQNPDLFVQSGQGGAFDEANRLAQAYGFKQCGQS